MKIEKIIPYFIHLRPKSFLPSFILVLSGYACSPYKSHDSIDIIRDFLAMYFIYAVFLWGGTSAINTYYDNDAHRPLNYLPNPPKIPPHLGLFGYFIMGLSLIITSFYNTTISLYALFFIFLSFAYSARIPFFKYRGKEIGIIDNLISASGSGFIAIFIGNLITNTQLDERIIFIGIAYTLSVFGTYPTTQLHQLNGKTDYKSERNYITLVGVKNSFTIAIICMLLSIMIIAATIIFGHYELDILSSIFYLGFFVSYLVATYKLLIWRQSPFSTPKLRYDNMLTFIIYGRILWIAAEWVYNP